MPSASPAASARCLRFIICGLLWLLMPSHAALLFTQSFPQAWLGFRS
jgi:hypothetical protein